MSPASKEYLYFLKGDGVTGSVTVCSCSAALGEALGDFLKIWQDWPVFWVLWGRRPRLRPGSRAAGRSWTPETASCGHHRTDAAAGLHTLKLRTRCQTKKNCHSIYWRFTRLSRTMKQIKSRTMSLVNESISLFNTSQQQLICFSKNKTSYILLNALHISLHDYIYSSFIIISPTRKLCS